MNALPKRLFVPFLAALSVLAVVIAPAAANDKVQRFDYSGSNDDIDVCGLIVDSVFAGTWRGTIHNYVIGPAAPPANDFWIGNFNDHGSETFTNTANGKSVTRTWIVNIKEASLVDIGGGFYEYTYAVSGPVIKFGGRSVDVGRINITDTIYFGDLSTFTDDYFVSGFVHSDAGRHPGYYSVQPFCDALVAAIG